MTSSATAPSTRQSLLVRLGNSADVEAWEAFISLYTPIVYNYCRRRGLQDADAQDVTQEVFGSVSRAIRDFEYDPLRGRFRGWLGLVASRAIAKHKAKAARPGQGRRQGTGQEVEEQSGQDDPIWIEEFQAQVLAAALDRLRGQFDENVWRAFEITWLENRSPAQASQVLARPKAWIYKAKFKVLARLKEEIEFLIADVAFFQNE